MSEYLKNTLSVRINIKNLSLDSEVVFTLPVLSIKDTLILQAQYDKNRYIGVRKIINDFSQFYTENQSIIDTLNRQCYGNDFEKQVLEKAYIPYMEYLLGGFKYNDKDFLDLMDKLAEKWNITPHKIQSELTFMDLVDYGNL